MRSTNITEIEHIIHKLPNKTSCGHDTVMTDNIMSDSHLGENIN